MSYQSNRNQTFLRRQFAGDCRRKHAAGKPPAERTFCPGNATLSEEAAGFTKTTRFGPRSGAGQPVEAVRKLGKPAGEVARIQRSGRATSRAAG